MNEKELKTVRTILDLSAASLGIIYVIWIFSFLFIGKPSDYEILQTLPFIIILPIIAIILVIISESLPHDKKNIIKKVIRESRNPKDPRKIKIERQSKLKEDKTVIKERVKVIYDLPEKCPSCGAPLQYEAIKMRGPNRAECSYCNSMFNLLEKEI